MTPRPQRTPGQARAWRELRDIAAAPASALLTLDDATDPARTATGLVARIALDTSALPAPARGGLRLSRDREDLVLAVPPDYPRSPPQVWVEHDRFLGHPHVLLGCVLCVYLDPAQEWRPSHGIRGFLANLWTWMRRAADGEFDPADALFHPVGGVPPWQAAAPLTVVARHDPAPAAGPYARVTLFQRTPARVDLLPADAPQRCWNALVVRAPGPLVVGPGTTLQGVCGALALAQDPISPAFRLAFGATWQPPDLPPRPGDFLARLAASAARDPGGSPAWFVLAVPTSRSPGADRHLVVGRVHADAADALRARRREAGPLMRIAPTDELATALVEWCKVSEERPSMTVRRDTRRPAAAFEGLSVAVWGCGGLGSWIAELVARAGAARVSLCDPFPVTGGLLVRQDYAENDIGTTKADALARRLREIRDGLDVDVVPDPYAVLADGSLPDCDVLVDATISLPMADALAAVWHRTRARPLVARVSADRATTTLALLTVTRPGAGADPDTADRAAGNAVLADPSLEAFRCFWDTADPADELTPAPGCSVPTFHGSAADLAAAAGALVTALGQRIAADAGPGSVLLALPAASGTAPPYAWLPAA